MGGRELWGKVNNESDNESNREGNSQSSGGRMNEQGTVDKNEIE